MKKLTILILSLILLLSDLGLSVCLAEEDIAKPWSIDSYVAIADVKPDGSLAVEEYITYKFTKDFSGVLKRKIDTFAASGVDGLSVFNVAEIDEEDISKSKLEPIPSESYDAILDEEYGMLHEIDVSLGKQDRPKTLAFKYTLNDLVGIYSDMALLDWSFLEKGDNHSVGNISISVKTPKGGDIQSVQSFLQGPLYSQQIKEENIINFEASLMDHSRDLRMILLLPTSVIPDGRKKIGNEITDQILGEMDLYEKEIAGIRKEYETRQLVSKLLTYFTSAIIIIAMLFIYVKYDRDPNIGIKPSYVNKIPANYYTPAELGVLMNRGKVKANYIIATLIDLINRGYLNIESTERNDFILSKNPDAKTGQLKSHEEYLIVWIFGDVGQGAAKVSIEQFEEWTKEIHNKKRYKHKYRTWENLVTKQASKWKFFEDVTKVKVFGFLLGVLATIPGIVLWTLGDMIKGLVIIALSLLLIIYSQLIRKRTEFGAVNNAEWTGFKDYIRDASQGNLPKPELDEWEKFLAYVIPINRVDVMLEQLRKIYGDNGLSNQKLFLLHKDNLDKTIYWINSFGRENKFRAKLTNLFSLFKFNGFILDKKG